MVCLSDKDTYLDRYAEPDKGWTDRDEARWPVPYWDVDTGMAAMLMLLTAVDAGLASCFFGVPPDRHDDFRAAFDVPANRTPVGVVSVGYAAPDRRSPSLSRGRRGLARSRTRAASARRTPGLESGRLGNDGAMARRTPPPPPDDFTERIVDIDVEQEMQGAFLEYAYSVIYSRALPDARDGLKPVQRRILYAMSEMGLRPDRAHVKSSRVVGEVMGKFHPHGDAAIYDALVRMAQPFSLRLPLVDGHGNFGSLDDGPAAPRYTEARPAAAALLMTTGLDEATVDFVPTYDDAHVQPEVLPSALPNLLVNGASGIAVGMATNMAPHNLVEVIGAARHLIAHPQATLEDLMRFVPGPDLPTGGRIVGLEGIREAYATGRGTFRTRATARIESVSARRKGIVVTELPYTVGPEKVVEKIKDLVQSKKLQGIADLKDLTDRSHGLRLVVEIKNGFHPEAILEQLYRLTPMEDSFGINNVALVDGQPRTLGLRELLQVYVDFRIGVVRRRTAHRLAKRDERLHLVEGLLIAIVDIDEVIQVIRSSDDAAAARARLMRGLRPDRAAGQLHPRPAAAAADQVLADRAGDREGPAAGRDRGAAGDPRPGLGAARRRLRPSWPRSPRPTAPRVVRSCSSRPAPRRRPPRRSRWPTTRAGCCCPPPACSPGPARPSRWPIGPDRQSHDVVTSVVPRHGARRRRPGDLAGPAAPAVRRSTCPPCLRRARRRTCPAGRRSARSSTCHPVRRCCA